MLNDEVPQPRLPRAMPGENASRQVCLLASQYSLIDHANALNNLFPVARQRNVKFVIGSSLNAYCAGTFASTEAARPRPSQWPKRSM